MHRFYVPPERLGDSIWLEPEDGHHAARVLRLRRGDRIAVFSGDGKERIVELTEVGTCTTGGRVVGEWEPGSEPRSRVTLAQAIGKGDKLEWVIQKGTELGVSAFIPLVTVRVVVELREEKARRKHERWQRIAREAAAQSGRTSVPAVGEAMRLADYLRSLPTDALALLAYEGESALSLREALVDLGDQPVHLIIGPEGGFAPEEVSQAAAAGVRIVTLGRRILRTETAGLAAAALVFHAAGDLG
ncbi:MAG: 16S rRNA (uracil(1498)-N(3))-methyltransferase [Bacillota bacterium]